MVTNEQGYPLSEKDLAGCVEVENGARTMIARHFGGGYRVESGSGQQSSKADSMFRRTS